MLLRGSSTPRSHDQMTGSAGDAKRLSSSGYDGEPTSLSHKRSREDWEKIVVGQEQVDATAKLVLQ